MKISEKKNIIKYIKKNEKKYKYIFFVDISRLNSETLLTLKRNCYTNNIIIKNFKNSLLKKIFNKKIHKILLGPTFLIFSNNITSVVESINNNSIYINNTPYPAFKGALIESIDYLGNKYSINDLLSIRPKNETIFKIINNLKKLIVFNLLKIKLNNNYTIISILKGLINKKNKK